MSRIVLCKVFKETAIALTVIVAGSILGAITGAASRMIGGGSILLGATEGAVTGSSAALSSYGISYNIRNYLDKKNVNGHVTTSVSVALGVGVGTTIFGNAAAILVQPFLPPDMSSIIVGGAAASAAVSGGILGALRPSL
jgi:hypothetical protein